MKHRGATRRNPGGSVRPQDLLLRADELLSAIEAYAEATRVVERDRAAVSVIGHYWRATSAFEEAVNQWRDDAQAVLGPRGPKKSDPRQIAAFDPERPR